MKVLFYMGVNRRNLSGVSWKIYKIECAGRTVTAYYGPATLDRRRVVPAGQLQSRSWIFPSVAAAKAFERDRIMAKLAKGYERRPRPGA